SAVDSQTVPTFSRSDAANDPATAKSVPLKKASLAPSISRSTNGLKRGDEIFESRSSPEARERFIPASTKATQNARRSSASGSAGAAFLANSRYFAGIL